MTNQERLTQLVQAGWSVQQASQILAGGQPTATGQPATAVVPYVAPTPVPSPFGPTGFTPGPSPIAVVKPGDTPPAGFEWSGLLTALGLGGVAAAVAAPVAAAYGVSELIGVQYPWQTGPGEGFIAPWNRNIVQDEQGMWVTPNTRPDLFTPEKGGTMGAAAMVGRGGLPTSMIAGAMGPAVVKQWSASGWPFAMTSDGKIHTVTKSGIRKSWRPYRSVVLGKKVSTGQARRAMGKLKAIKDLANDIEKLGGTRTVYRTK